MSLKHFNAAMNVTAGKSSLKLLLLCVADMAGAVDGEFWPSVNYLSEITEMNRKTVISGLKQLEDMGVIEDTGKRDGRTGQIVIYRFCLDALKSPENGTVPKTEQFQKRTERVPKTDRKSTENGQKESQKRDTEPKGTVKEPKRTGRARGSRIPADWQPNDQLKAFCQFKLPSIPVEEVVDKFVDYWKAEAGSNASKLDWDATFRNWVRREAEMQRRNGGVRRKQSITEINDRIMAEFTAPVIDIKEGPWNR